jgi:hypothetical protein
MDVTQRMHLISLVVKRFRYDVKDVQVIVYNQNLPRWSSQRVWRSHNGTPEKPKVVMW